MFVSRQTDDLTPWEQKGKEDGVTSIFFSPKRLVVQCCSEYE